MCDVYAKAICYCDSEKCGVVCFFSGLPRVSDYIPNYEARYAFADCNSGRAEDLVKVAWVKQARSLIIYGLVG